MINNLVVFCNDGEQFTLVLNGALQNTTPQTRVVVEGLTLPKYEVKIMFKNQDLKNTNTTLTFFSTGWECEFALNKRGKRKYTMDFLSQKKIDDAPAPPMQNNVSAPQDNVSNGSVQTAPVNAVPLPSNPPLSSTPPIIEATPTTAPVLAQIPQTPTGSGCSTPMTAEEFMIFRDQVMKKHSDADKQAAINRALQNGCVMMSQLKELLLQISSEQVKLDIAKNAYSRITDIENYTQLINTFLVSDLREDFKRFMKNKK